MTSRLTETSRSLLGLFTFTAAVLLFLWLAGNTMFGGRGRMTVAESPNGAYRASLDERACGIDRNFRLWIWDRESQAEHQIGWPISVDQSPLIEHEHFVWSPDSRYVALVGDRYFVTDEAKLPSGDQILLVYDTEEAVLYSNYDRDDPFAPFPAGRAVEVFGEVILQPAPAIQ